ISRVAASLLRLNSLFFASPSANCSTTSTVALPRSCGISPQIQRQQAQAQSRNFRSVATLFRRMDRSILLGSGQVSHSSSVMALFLPEDEVHGPAAADVWPGAAQVTEEGRVGTAGVFQGVSQFPHPAEGTLVVDGPGEPGDGAAVLLQPGFPEFRRAERVAEDVAEQGRLGFGFVHGGAGSAQPVAPP